MGTKTPNLQCYSGARPHRSRCCIFAFADFLQHSSFLAKLTVTEFKLNYNDQEQHELRKKPLSFRRTHILIRPMKKYFNLSVWTLIFLLITGKRPLCLQFQVNIFEISFAERESWFFCVCVMKIGAVCLPLEDFPERNVSSYTYLQAPPRPQESGEELNWESSFELLVTLQEGT